MPYFVLLAQEVLHFLITQLIAGCSCRLILTCEERVYDQVVEDLNSREQETCQPVHVINVDIQDNHEEATLGAFLICELCQCIQHTEDMENEIDELLQEFEEKSGRTFLHTVCFY